MRKTPERKAKGEACASSLPRCRWFVPRSGASFSENTTAILYFIMLILEVVCSPPVRHHLIYVDMKRKYCLVRLNGDLLPSSFVYVVWVGSSLRESTKLALVEEFCKDCGWYFKQWSPLVDSALEKRKKFLRVDGNRTAPALTFHSLNIDQCYDAIIDDSWATIEANHVMTPQEKFMRFRNDPSFLLSFHRKQCNTSCSPSERKYLSHRKRESVSQLVCAIGLGFVLFLLDAFVSNFIITSSF